jgi:hypothetical protein
VKPHLRYSIWVQTELGREIELVQVQTNPEEVAKGLASKYRWVRIVDNRRPPFTLRKDR